VREGVVQARLVAADAGVDLLRVPRRRLAHPSGSASIGRAIEISWAAPPVRISSAASGMLMRLAAATGMVTSMASFAVNSTKAARGTEVTMVGTRDSCQPMSVLIIVTPAASSSLARATMSAQACPCSTRSAMDSRNRMRKSAPTAARVRRTISTAIRRRFCGLPPQPSVRLLVRSARNWLMK